MTQEIAAAPDAELVDQALSAPGAGELSAVFAVIYERHAVAVMRVCGAMLTDRTDAENAAHDTFEAAFKWLAARKMIEHPEHLAAWLSGIARNRCRQRWAQRDRETPYPRVEISDDDAESASRRRLAEVERMLGVVAGTFTDPQQELFRMVIREGLNGARLAERMGISPEMASRKAYEIIREADRGFGALVLARDGRRYCSGLALILDEAGWHGGEFSRILRLRIIRHLSDCKICDNCATCNRSRARLVSPYAPVAIPLLIAGALRERVMGTIRLVADAAHLLAADRGQSPPRPPAAPLGLAADGTRPPVDAAPAIASAGRPPAPSVLERRPAPAKAGRRRRKLITPLATTVAVVVVITTIVVARSGPPTTSQPVVLSSDTTTCPHKTLAYALCFPSTTAVSDGSNPLLRRLLNSGEGDVTQVNKQFSVQFSPPSATALDFFSQEPEPSPLPPPQCFNDDAELSTSSLAGNSAVEVVRVGSNWAEMGVIPLTAPAAARAAEEFSSGLENLSSCADLSLDGDGWSLTDDSTGTAVSWMQTFTLRDVGPIPPAYTGDGVTVQYSEFGVTGNDYVYVTAFSRSVADSLAAALAAKQ